MTITQTIEVSTNNRSITLEIPPQIPAGKVILTFTPVSETQIVEFSEAPASEVMAAGDEIISRHNAAFRALAK